MDNFSIAFLGSTPVIRLDLYPKPISQVPVMDFFGNIQRAEPALEPYDIRGIRKRESFAVLKEFLDNNQIERVSGGRVDEDRPVYLWKRDDGASCSWTVIFMRLALLAGLMSFIWKRMNINASLLHDQASSKAKEA